MPGFASVTPTRAQQFVISNNKTLGSTAVNEFRVSFFRTATLTNKPTSGLASLSSLGFVTGAGTLGIVKSGPAGFPETVPPLYFTNFYIGTEHAHDVSTEQHLSRFRYLFEGVGRSHPKVWRRVPLPANQ